MGIMYFLTSMPKIIVSPGVSVAALDSDGVAEEVASFEAVPSGVAEGDPSVVGSAEGLASEDGAAVAAGVAAGVPTAFEALTEGAPDVAVDGVADGVPAHHPDVLQTVSRLKMMSEMKICCIDKDRAIIFLRPPKIDER
jgi:hypothetical protein